MPNDADNLEAQLARWNKPSRDSNFELVVGGTPDEGDTRATVSPDPNANYHDDGQDAPESDDYSEWNNAQLKDELRRRDLPVGGKHDELVSRLEEHDEEQSSDDEDDEDDEE